MGLHEGETKSHTLDVSLQGTRDSIATKRRDLDVDRGRTIGFEFARLGMALPEKAEGAVHEGYAEGKHHFGSKSEQSTQWERKLVRLKLSAWLRSRIVDENVTPGFLEEIMETHCPITRIEMTTGTGTHTDATIDRVYNGGAYAVGNIAYMSSLANAAKGRLMPIEIAEIAMNGKDTDGLTAMQWLRLAALVCSATPPGVKRIDVPILVLPPRGLLVSSRYVVGQWCVTQACLQGKTGDTWGRLRKLCKGKALTREMDELLLVLHCSLVRRLRHGENQCPVRFAIEDAWEEPMVYDAFTRVWRQLGQDVRLNIETLSRRPEAGMSKFVANGLDHWALPTRGYAP